tara:strand:- start:956 stop:1462 length:507 start_codon:yes stop_codon:yes gene_type:complete
MLIHNSYNKKDLIYIINQNNIKISSTKNTSKKEIKKALEKYINENELENYNFLECENNVKRLTVKQKDEILLSAKKIIAFCKNGWNLERSLFTNILNVIDEGKKIANFGDIPSVRRAIKMLNLKLEPKIEIIISENISKNIEDKKLLKSMSIPTFQVNRKEGFWLSFD